MLDPFSRPLQDLPPNICLSSGPTGRWAHLLFLHVQSDLPLQSNCEAVRIHSETTKPNNKLQEIDDLFETAGLVRNRRKSPAGHHDRSCVNRARLRRSKQELSLPAPDPLMTWKRSGIAPGSAVARTEDDQQLALAWIQHAVGRGEPGLLCRGCSGRTESRLYRRRQPRGRCAESPIAGGGRHRRCASLRL